MSKDRFVKIDFPEKYGVPEGTRDKTGVQFYSISAFHQLHCLVRQSYQNSIRTPVDDEQQAMFRAIIYNTTSSVGTETAEAEGWSHLGHCFTYLRDAIRCHADSTLEWPDIITLPNGSSYHQPKTTLLGCKRIDVLERFVEDNKWISPDSP